jgi:hypothetical protein
MLSVSRQRLYQLFDERPDFPRPVTYDPEALWDIWDRWRSGVSVSDLRGVLFRRRIAG